MQYSRTDDIFVSRAGGNSCWNCEDLNIQCDGNLEGCRQCSIARIRCSGYPARFNWPRDLIGSSTANDAQQVKQTKRTRRERSPKQVRCISPHPFRILSSMGLPSEENRLAVHFIKNIAKLALAIDYHGNGYRKLARMALHEPVVLNAMLAVACAHISRWQKTTDTGSRLYFRKAVSLLQQRFRNPTLVKSEHTVAVMLLLSTYEIFNGTNRWKHHYDAISGWIKAYSPQVSLDPFLKTWITLIETQSGLNRGVATIPQVVDWSSSSSAWREGVCLIDPFMGCSGKLPRLMLEAAQCYSQTRQAQVDGMSSDSEDLRRRTGLLQEEIRACTIPFSASATPPLAVTCSQEADTVIPFNDFTENELSRRATATAEILRHATHIYVHRICNDPSHPLPPNVHASFDSVFDLLTYVPDAIGPGANLGWALVVVGSEVDNKETREFIRCRWKALEILGLGNTESGAKLLENVWVARDDARAFGWHIPRWQDVMRDSDAEQILL